MAVARPDEVPRPQLAEAGLFVLLVAAPLAFAPLTTEPFADIKLPLVVGGTALLWFSGIHVDRRIAGFAAAWFALSCISAALGVDRMRSLTAQTGLQGSGLIVILTCGVLAAASSGLTERLRKRAIDFSIAAGLAVALVGLGYRFFPSVTESWLPDQGLRGSTMGNPLFAATIVGVALACLVGADRGPFHWQVVSAILLTSASASFGERLTLLLPIVAVGTAVWLAKRRRSEALVLCAVTVVVCLTWLAIDPLLPREGGEGTRAQLTGVTDSDAGRIAAWEGALTGWWKERPLTGWGSGNTGSAYLRGSSADEVEESGREWADAHNVAIESVVTTGPLSTAAMLAVLVVCAIRGLRRDHGSAWATAAAATIGTFALIQPTSVVLTPLLFFHAGAGGRADRTRGSQGWRILVATLLVLASITSVVMLAAATFERWGRRYGEVWALETALDLQPWRISAQRELALRLSSDASSGDAAAAARARELIRDAVDDHPWNPDVRLWAAQVEHLMRNDDAALAWVQDHVERFPADREILENVRRSLDRPGFALPDDIAPSPSAQP